MEIPRNASQPEDSRSRTPSLGDSSSDEAATDRTTEDYSRVDRVRSRAYELYLARGDEPGDELEDWLQTERKLGDRSGEAPRNT